MTSWIFTKCLTKCVTSIERLSFEVILSVGKISYFFCDNIPCYFYGFAIKTSIYDKCFGNKNKIYFGIGILSLCLDINLCCAYTVL